MRPQKTGKPKIEIKPGNKGESKRSSSAKKTSAKILTRAQRQKLAELALEALKKEYPQPACALEFQTPFESLVAVVLSAQCTDKRVNMVTPTLFEKFPDVYAFAVAPVEEIEEAIKTCGFYHAKAAHISAAAKMIVDRYDGIVPDKFDELVKLPGVGRKTANCILGAAFRIPSGFVVDTHVLRLSRKIGLSDETTPEKVEEDLNKLFPREEWIDASHRLISLGRQYCIARRPRCEACPLHSFCLKRP